jgi:hypothetical protein
LNGTVDYSLKNISTFYTKPTSIMFEKGITHVAFIPLAIEREMLGFSKVFSVLFCDNKNN